MQQIDFGKEKINYIIKRTNRRKTVGFSFNTNSEVVVASPRALSIEIIESLLKKKEAWIVKNLRKERDNKLYLKEKNFFAGEKILFMGKEYLLETQNIFSGEPGVVKIEEGRIIVGVKEGFNGHLKKELLAFYFSKANEIISKVAERFGLLTETTPKKIIIKNQKKRWGSCSSKGVIRLNWRLIMAPLSLIEYVVLHELCHLRHMNHSRFFWGFLEKFMPDYKQRRRILKANDFLFAVNVI